MRLKINGILGVISLCLLVACTEPEAETNAYPTDLQGKRTMLDEKKKEARSIEDLIVKLESEIEALDPTEIKLRKVSTMSIEPRDLERLVQIQGSIVADDFVMASAEVGGRLISMNLEEGDYIRRGQRVGTVDMESLKKQIEEIEKSLELANEVYGRQDRLWKQNIGSEIQYLQAKNSKERLEKSLETIRYNLTKGEIYAPASGVVEKVMLNAGEMASPGAPILQILNVNKVKVSIDVPEKYLKTVRKGSRIKIQIPTIDYEKTVKVTDIGRMIDPGNRTFKVEADISSNGGKIKPNLMVLAYLSDLAIKDAIALNTELIQQDIDGSTFVFLADQDAEGKMVVRKQYIQTGESIDNELVVTTGLNGQETIIVEGARIVNEGQEVIIENTEG